MSYDDTILADDPVAYWKLEELTPPPALPNLACTDDGPNGHDGSLLPNADGGLVQGISGPIETDSPSYGMSGGIARIPNSGNVSGALDITGDITLECWAKSTSTGTETLINRGGDTTTMYMSFGQRSTGLFADRVFFVLPFATGGFSLISSPIPDLVWTHIVGFRGAGQMGLYINGCLDVSRNDLPTAAITPAAAPWRLGYMTNLVFGVINRTAGLSHVAIYDKKLSAARAFAHYQAGKSSIIPPCNVEAGYRPDCLNVNLEVA